MTMQNSNTAGGARPRRSDAGFSLPELLIAMTVSSLLAAALAMAFSVTTRSQLSAQDRIAESKDVTFVQTWLPADLSSATQTWIEPSLPFPLNTPLTGSNVVTLSRIDVETADEYLIMYRYEELPDRGYVLARYRIDNPGCPTPNPVIGRCEADESVKRIGVAYELPAPPDPTTWDPATESPFWAVEVTRRNAGTAGTANATGEDVTVHFNSGSVYIAGGSGLSAGQQIDPDPQVIPDPVAPPSRCGRRILLLLDLSTSVVTDWNSPDLQAPENLSAAATNFVNAFRGTPGSMNVVGFDKWIEPISAGGPGVYFDLLNDPTREADALVNNKFVDMVTNTVNGQPYYTSSNPYGFGPHSNGPHQTASGGGTNWEVALMSSYALPKDWHEIDGNGDDRTKDRSDLEYQDDVPDLVVLLTDGKPTRRLDDFYNYTNFGIDNDGEARVTSQAAEKANLAREFGVSDIVGVLVGDTGNVSKLAQVVGGTAWNELHPSDPNSNAEVADYFAADFDQLGDVVKAIAQRECGGALTLQKRFTDGTVPSTTGVWDFFNDEQGTKTLDYGTDSSVTFQHQFLDGETSKQFSIEEQPRDGWVLQTPTCESGGEPVHASRITRVDPTEPGDPVRWIFTLEPDDAMSCLMHSAPA